MSLTNFQYKYEFAEIVRHVNSLLLEWFAGPRETPPDLDSFDEMIYLKNAERVVTHSNIAYREFFADGVLPIGKQGDSFLHESIIQVSRHSDALMLDGVQRVEFDHIGSAADGKKYLLTSFKRPFAECHNYEPYSILGITRIVELISSSLDNGLDALEQFAVYQNFPVQDKRICELYSDGHSVRDIASKLDLSTKAIDNHRKKIMRELQLEKPVEIVKMMVRFEERGLKK